METLLTSIADKRKGEAIAYRMVILDAIKDNAIRHPGDVLWIYILRSNVLHGSSLNEATNTEYHTMLEYARRTLKNYLEVMTERKLKKQNELFKLLEASPHAQTLVNWLGGFTDQRSKEIMLALKESR